MVMVALAIGLLITGISLGSKGSEVSRLEGYLQGSTAKVIELNNTLTLYRRDYKPVEFESVEQFRAWVKLQDLALLQEANWERALRLQNSALEDGYILGYEILVNTISQSVEVWPIAKIGTEVYCIEPAINIVTLYYPTPAWRGGGKWELPDIDIPEMPKVKFN